METIQNLTHIYLADDDAEDRSIFAESLKQTTMKGQLTAFENGNKLLQQLNNYDARPDIIFLDLKMPGKSGKECLQEIRKDPKLNHIPIVIFTCTAYINDIREAYEYGANLYVTKNVFIKNNKQALTLILETVLKHSSMIPDKEKFVLGGDASFIWVKIT